MVAKALKYLETKIKKDGGVYDQGLSNYMTSLAIVAFKETNAGGKYDKVIDAATKYVRSLQFDEGLTEKDPKFGGAGLRQAEPKGRPDLSNTQFLVEALLAGGRAEGRPGIKKALVVHQPQPEPEERVQRPAVRGEGHRRGQGRLRLQPARPGQREEREAHGGGRPAERGRDDLRGAQELPLRRRVEGRPAREGGASRGSASTTRSTENPGQGQAGLFYYYHTFAKAMDALGEDQFEDAKGVKHDWRQELFDELKKRQKEDGSWANANGAFLESMPELATAFALLALSYCRKK